MIWPFKRKFKTVDVDPKDVEPGRKSRPDDETLAGGIGRLTDFYGIRTPKFPLEYLEVLELLSIWNPDISQALNIIVNLGNTGHEIRVEGGSAEAVADRINTLAAGVYRTGGGMDGLVNHFLRQIAMMGALSGEWVIHDNICDGVRDTVVVPVRTIRFRREDGEYKPCQYVGGGFDLAYIDLNPVTYSYSPVQTMDDSPYGIPGFYAALKNIEVQLDSIGGIAHIIRKMGLLGFLDVALEIPEQKPGESDPEYAVRLRTRLKNYSKAYAENFSKGVAVHYKDQEAKHNNVGSTAAAGAKTIFNLNEEQIFSALDIPPSLAGRSYSTTETYAGVDYDRLITRLDNSRRMIKRFMEKGYNLDLALAGINAQVTVAFNENAGFKEQEAAEAEGLRIDNVIKKRDAGFINDDEAAQELGYEKATGQDLTHREPSMTFAFNRDKGRYEYVRNILPVVYTRNESMAKGDKRSQDYAEMLRVVLEPAEDKAVSAAVKAAKKAYKSETAFSGAVIDAFTSGLKKGLNTAKIIRVINSHVKTAWDWYRYEDTKDVPNRQSVRRFGLDIEVVDANALRYLTHIETYYFGQGNYLADNPQVGNKFINWLENEYIDKGLNIRDEETMKEFQKNFTDMVKETTWQKINQIVNTTMARIQNFGQTMKLYEAGFKRFRIAGPTTYPACDYCIYMVGRVFEVEKAAVRLATVVEKGFEDPKDLPPFLAGAYPLDDLEKMTDKQLQDEGFESPPYHPECRHRKVAED